MAVPKLRSVKKYIYFNSAFLNFDCMFELCHIYTSIHACVYLCKQVYLIESTL